MFLVTIALLSLSAEAAQAPGWTARPPAEDASYKYYVGRGTGISEAEAVSLAIEDAKTQAIRDNFGMATRVHAQSYEELANLSMTKRMDEASFSVIIRDFLQIDLYQQGREYWVLYRYGKNAIYDERKRLASLEKDKLPQFSVVEGKKQKGGVEITTEPQDVAVFIDGIQYGYSPTKIAKRLEAGVHTIRLELDNYKTVEEELIIAPDTMVQVNKILVPDRNMIPEDENPKPKRTDRDEMEEKIKERFYSTENPRQDLS